MELLKFRTSQKLIPAVRKATGSRVESDSRDNKGAIKKQLPVLFLRPPIRHWL